MAVLCGMYGDDFGADKVDVVAVAVGAVVIMGEVPGVIVASWAGGAARGERLGRGARNRGALPCGRD